MRTKTQTTRTRTRRRTGARGAPAAPPNESALVRLRDAGRTALPDVSGGLVDDLPQRCGRWD